MVTPEAKLDALAAQMNSMMKLMETFNCWRLDIDDFATALSRTPEISHHASRRWKQLPHLLRLRPRSVRKRGGTLLATTSQHHHRGLMSGPWSSIHPWPMVSIILPPPMLLRIVMFYHTVMVHIIRSSICLRLISPN
jgi:hypothetical protein